MRILLVDDHVLFRDGLKLLLSGLAPGKQFEEAGSCEAALSLAPEPAPDLILLDMNLPGVSGREALRVIRNHYQAPVVVLSGEDDARLVRQVVEDGAAGFIPKSSTQQVMIAALQLILAGGTYVPPCALSTVLIEEVSVAPGDETSPLSHLSDRQRDVLKRVVQGKPNKRIASELDISEATVKAHLSAAFRALGVRNRTEAVFAVAQLERAVA